MSWTHASPYWLDGPPASTTVSPCRAGQPCSPMGFVSSGGPLGHCGLHSYVPLTAPRPPCSAASLAAAPSSLVLESHGCPTALVVALPLPGSVGPVESLLGVSQRALRVSCRRCAPLLPPYLFMAAPPVAGCSGTRRRMSFAMCVRFAAAVLSCPAGIRFEALARS